MKFFENEQRHFCECRIGAKSKMGFGLLTVFSLREAQMVLAAVMLLGANSFLSYANAEVGDSVSITPTGWEMYRSENVLPLGFNLDSRDDLRSFDFALIPAASDLSSTGWVDAPYSSTIGFSEKSRISGSDGSNGCKSAVDYTYFQTFVDVPSNTDVTNLSITFSGIDIDELVRVSVFDEAGNELLVPNSNVSYLDTVKEIVLTDYIHTGENRIVITQVDNCPTTNLGNRLESVVVAIDAIEIPTAEATLRAAPTDGQYATFYVHVTGDDYAAIPDLQILASGTCDENGNLGVDAEIFTTLSVDPYSGITVNATNLYAESYELTTSELHLNPDDPEATDGEAFLQSDLIKGDNNINLLDSRYVAVSVIGSDFTSSCIVASPRNDSWVRPETLVLDGSKSASTTGYVSSLGNSRWYKFAIQPGSRASIDLSNLPEDYDIAVFRDIQLAFDKLATEVSSVDDLNRMGAEFAPSMYSPSMYSPSMYSPSMYSPSMYSPSMYSPSMYSPSMYSPSMYSPSMYSPSMYSPSMYSPSMYSPSMYSPDVYNEKNYTSAQLNSLIRVSAQLGTINERVIADTWNNTGNFYVRVTGKNGVYNTDTPFNLSISLEGGLCEEVTADTSSLPLPVDFAPSLDPDVPYNAGDYSIILFDSYQLSKSKYDNISELLNQLKRLADRAEVKGVVIDLAGYDNIQKLHQQADTNYSCPYAENLTAHAIKEVIDDYRTENTRYIVLAGSDGEIPFFRYPDQGLLGPEQNYEPPMRYDTQSEASLRANYILGQDEYGASMTLSLNDMRFPVPELAVGRLVETPAEMMSVIDAYLNGTTDGVGAVFSPNSTLVTGYDFLSDAATEVQKVLVKGTASTIANHALINDIWTADDLIDSIKLLDQDIKDENGTVVIDDIGNDIVFLAGHFSANSTLAADYETTVLVEQIAGSGVDMENSLFFSAGCHSGYNIVDNDRVKGLTNPFDWSQMFASKGATLIAGTGYQYGDTDFVEYSERLYLQFAKELRTGSNPVAVGDALVKAKQHYLSHTPDIRGLHRKSVLISTLFGLPMLRIGLPEDPIVNDPEGSRETMPVETGPGAAAPVGLGLSTLELNLKSTDLYNNVTPEVTVTLDESNDDNTGTTGNTLLATYLIGQDGIITNPGEPAIPLKTVNVSANDSAGNALSLRGVGFLGGKYEEDTVVPFTGAPSTELRGVHIPFSSPANFPMRLAIPNFYGALTDYGVTEEFPDGATNLHVTPVQHRDEDIGDADATRRKFNTLDFKLFYSNNTTTYTQTTGDGNTPALVAPPSMSGINAFVDIDGMINFTAFVDGAPAAGIQSVWVTYTINGVTSPEWVTIYLDQGTLDSRLWKKVIPGNIGINNLVYMVQAVNGAGRVSADDNYGFYHKLQSNGNAPSTLTLATDGLPVLQYGGTLNSTYFEASLTDVDGFALNGMPIFFMVGDTTRMAKTDVNGEASINIPLNMIPPGTHYVTAYFPGTNSAPDTNGYQPAGATLTEQLTVKQAQPSIDLTGPDLFYVDQNVDGYVATLKDQFGTPLVQRTVYFSIKDPQGTLIKTVSVITNFQGEAFLNAPPITVEGTGYSVEVYFLGAIPTENGKHVVDSPLFLPAFTSQPFEISLIPTGLTVSAPTNVYADQLITSYGIEATLVDSSKDPDESLSGHTVAFTIGDNSFTATTNGDGVAKLDAYATPLDTNGTLLPAGESFYVSASFNFNDDNTSYAASGASTAEPVIIDWVPTILTISVPPPVFAEQLISSYGIKATLKDIRNDPAETLSSGYKVVFTIGGESFEAETNSEGVAKLDANAVALSTTTIPLDSTLAGGQGYTVTASFADGGTIYAGSDTLNQPSSIDVDLIPTALTVSVLTPVSAAQTIKSYGITATLVNTNEDPDSPLSGKKVTFTIGGYTFTAITGKDGVASLDELALPLDLDGKLAANADYEVSASFADDDTYAAPITPSLSSVHVDWVSTNLINITTSQVAGVDGIDIEVSASLVIDISDEPLSAGHSIIFTIGGNTFTKTTDSSGVATLQTSLALPSGSYEVSIDFHSDSTYGSANATTTLNLIRGINCPTSDVKGKISILYFCYLIHEVDGKVAITNGTLIVGEGGYVDQKVEQFGDGSIIINSLASIRGMIVETGEGDVVVTGIAGDSKVGGQIDESGGGDVIVNVGGIVYGNISEENDGDVIIYGTVEGNVFESGDGRIYDLIETGGNVTGGLQQD